MHLYDQRVFLAGGRNDVVPLDLGRKQDVIARTPFVWKSPILCVPNIVELLQKACRDKVDLVVQDVIDASLQSQARKQAISVRSRDGEEIERRKTNLKMEPKVREAILITDEGLWGVRFTLAVPRIVR